MPTLLISYSKGLVVILWAVGSNILFSLKELINHSLELLELYRLGEEDVLYKMRVRVMCFIGELVIPELFLPPA